MTVPDKPWKVLVDDNFEYHETSQTPVADFDTREEAIAYCRARSPRPSTTQTYRSSHITWPESSWRGRPGVSSCS